MIEPVIEDRVFRNNFDLDDLIEQLQQLKKDNPLMSDWRIAYDMDKMNGWFDYRPIRGVFIDKEDEYILLSPMAESIDPRTAYASEFNIPTPSDD